MYIVTRGDDSSLSKAAVSVSYMVMVLLPLFPKLFQRA